MLIVWPLTQSATTAESKAMGIVITTINELRQSRRNSEDHQSRQECAEEPFTDEPGEGAHDVSRLVEHEINLDVFRARRFAWPAGPAGRGE